MAKPATTLRFVYDDAASLRALLNDPTDEELTARRQPIPDSLFGEPPKQHGTQPARMAYDAPGTRLRFGAPGTR